MLTWFCLQSRKTWDSLSTSGRHEDGNFDDETLDATKDRRRKSSLTHDCLARQPLKLLKITLTHVAEPLLCTPTHPPQLFMISARVVWQHMHMLHYLRQVYYAEANNARHAFTTTSIVAYLCCIKLEQSCIYMGLLLASADFYLANTNVSNRWAMPWSTSGTKILILQKPHAG